MLPRLRRRHRAPSLLRSVALVGLLALGLGVLPATSAGAQQGDQRSEREAVRDKKEAVSGQIDLLQASDVQLQGEVQRLANLVREQQNRVDLAQAGLADLESKLGGLADEVNQAQHDLDQAKRRASDRAVTAYMHPGIDSLATVLQANDYDQAHRRRTILGEVAHFDHEVVEGFVHARDQLGDKQERLAEARRQADALRAQEEQALGELQAAQARQEEAKRALDTRIADFRAEADSLAGQEANLTALITKQEAAERARQLAAATTTTTAPPPKVELAAPNAPAPTGGGLPSGGGSPAQTTSTVKASTPTTAKPPSGPKVTLLWPVSGVLTSPFGSRWGRLHAGIDIGVPLGTPIRASAAGTVFFCGEMSGYGNVVLIDHHNGLVTLYAHQSRLGCSNGQSVGAGQVIGYAGSTGHSTGPHVHFEVRVNGTPVDPLGYLP